jgi:hypothetical protein
VFKIEGDVSHVSNGNTTPIFEYDGFNAWNFPLLPTFQASGSCQLETLIKAKTYQQECAASPSVHVETMGSEAQKAVGQFLKFNSCVSTCFSPSKVYKKQIPHLL